ncbi:MAG TPA: peptidoglycan-binding protein [Myxococcaceae bacterium]|jgi:peptidoglycan hydrolase-like protein with peptidoglycan-binding domain
MQTTTLRTSNANALVPTAATSATSNPNAILSRYQPTGASAATARQDGLSAGVGASQQMARTDLSRLQQYKGAFEAAAAKHGLPPALLAAIASRESRAGAALDSNGRGDGGNGFGLMQVDFRYHSPRGGPYSAQHIDQAAGILKGMLNEVKAKHPSWSPEQQLRGAVAAYNSGVSNVQTIAGMDRGTTGNDYSNDVWARAQALAPSFGGTGGTTGPVTPGTPPPATGAVLKQGSSGPEVKQLQQTLNKLGYSVGTADGVFGPNTEAAVKKFQAAKGLEADGVVGPKTQQALAKASAGGDGFEPTPGQWTAAPSVDDVLKNGKQLKLGMQGPAVAQVQQLLGLEADGKFGPATKAAVDAFQKANKLTPPPGLEGVVGKTTLEALRKSGGNTGVGGISAQGREQMRKLLEYAEANNTGASRGRCFEYVWKYMTSNGSGFGKIRNYNDAADMPSTYARNFAEYMNSNGNAERWGLRRLNITNPYDAPKGAIVVVAPGSPGTAHPTAGDIAIAAGNGRFVNDGPNMGYGDPANFLRNGGRVLGVYVPM